MTVYMTQTEFAQHRGISQPRVSKMISSGKISGCIKKISGRKLIDRDKADAALDENLDRVYNKSTRQYGKNKKSRKDSTKSEPTQEEQAKTIQSAGLKIVSLSEAQKLKANYDAALKKLEYKEKKKELINSDDARKILSDVVLSARSKILSIKGKLAPLLKEFIEDQENFGIAMDSIETALRDILTEMADSGIKK